MSKTEDIRPYLVFEMLSEEQITHLNEILLQLGNESIDVALKHNVPDGQIFKSRAFHEMDDRYFEIMFSFRVGEWKPIRQQVTELVKEDFFALIEKEKNDPSSISGWKEL